MEGNLASKGRPGFRVFQIEAKAGDLFNLIVDVDLGWATLSYNGSHYSNDGSFTDFNELDPIVSLGLAAPADVDPADESVIAALVVGDDSVVEIGHGGQNAEPILFTVDGREVLRLAPGSVVSVEKGAKPLCLVRMPGHSFYETLRKKLRWYGG